MKITNNKWTDSEVRLLKKEYGTATTQQLAVRLNKTPTAIYSKVQYLRKRGWTFDSTRRRK